MENQAEIRIESHRRIVMLPLPYQGHINPMLQLANLLHSKGFTITILVSAFNQPKTANYPHFTFKFVLDNTLDDEQLDSKATLDVSAAFSRMKSLNKCVEGQLRHLLEVELAAKDEPPVTCFIADALFYSAKPVAKSLKLPGLVLRTSSIFCYLVYAAIPRLQDDGYFSPSDNKSKSGRIAGRFPVLKAKDIVKMMNFRRGSDDSEEVICNMVPQTKSCSGIIWNSVQELEAHEFQTILQYIPESPSFTIPFHNYFTAAPSSLQDQDRTVLPWLDQQPDNSVVYVSFGSVAQLEEEHFHEVVHGLIDSGRSFVWVVRPGVVSGSPGIDLRLPDGFPGERGRIVKWAPQQEVLGHEAVGAFWTHGGWNSTMEGVCKGIPMICSPFWGDQPLDARYMSDAWKVGVYLENGWKREEITNAIKRVMVDEDIRERARVLKQKLDQCLVKGGSAYESLESLVAYISSF